MKSKPSNEIKQNGVYYTGLSVANFMATILAKNVQNNEKIKFNIMDPSSGTGNLLDAVKSILPISNCIGIELNPLAAKECKRKHPKSFQADFLSTTVDSEIDLIISNPPYFNVRNLTQSQRDEYKKRFKSYDGNGDILNLFVEHSLSQLKEGGEAIYIVQRYFLETEHSGLRDILLRHTILSIIDFQTEKLFLDSGCNAETCIIHILKSPPSKNHRINIGDGLEIASQLRTGSNPNISKSSTKYLQSLLTSHRWIFSDIDSAALITSDILLGDICELGVGYLTSADKAYELTSREAKEVEYQLVRPVIKNKDIIADKNPQPSSFWLCPKGQDLKNFPKAQSILEDRRGVLLSRPLSFKNRNWYDYKGYQNPHITEANQKIVFRSFGQEPSFAICNDSKHIYSNNVGGLIIRPEFQNKISLQDLASFLNSEKAFSYMKAKLLKKKSSGFDFKPKALRSLPIPSNLLS